MKIVVHYLSINHFNIIPKFEYLRANNNKCFMELLGTTVLAKDFELLKSRSFGSYIELLDNIDTIKYPVVVKTSDGALSKGVYLAETTTQLKRYVKKISWTFNLNEWLKDIYRTAKYRGYKSESFYRKKFILQEFVPNLKNDWKVLVYFDCIFILERGVRADDFRASGSKFNYKAGSKASVPESLFDFVSKVRESLNVPMVSLDIIYSDSKFRIIEFQVLHFGTSTINFSDVYFSKENDIWTEQKNEESEEYYYAYAISSYLDS